MSETRTLGHTELQILYAPILNLRIADETARIHFRDWWGGGLAGRGAGAGAGAADSLDREQDYIPAFYRGLAETGFVEGRNVAVEHRWLYGSGQGPALAADLAHRQVAVIVVVTNRLSLIAKSATQIIPSFF